MSKSSFGYSEVLKSSGFVPTGFTDVEGARAVARRLFETYDRDKNGNIDSLEVVPMIVDVYRAFNRSFYPAKGDIESYYKVLDINKDGKVTFEDLEQLCIKYLIPQEKMSYSTTQFQVKKYSSEVEQKLDVARRLFQQFDTDKSGYLEESEIGKLMKATYEMMGITNYTPSNQDIKTWIKLANPKYEGRVSLPEYELVVIRALRNAGIKIE